VETYILNNTTDASSKRLAQLENSVLGGAKDDAQGQLDVALILKDLRLDANLAESKRLACLLQSHLIASREVREGSPEGKPKDPRADRGVRQALFHVLLGADMPSALVEAGFLTHPKDRALLLSPSGQRSIGRAVALAILEFKRKKASLQLARCKVH
jgi:N-acetylmuramoyl-L-alanine amidase